MPILREAARAIFVRALDLSVALGVLVGGAPIWIVVALVIRLTAGRPVLYRATRCGQGGQPFEMLKFRTMRKVEGPSITAADDARITRFGSMLRLYKVDEIPQLINVLQGRMSIVGPRPEDPRFVDLDDPVHRLVLSVRPGLTSPASVRYRHEQALLSGVSDPELTYRTEVLPEKLRIDAEWLERRTIGSDFRIATETATAILRRLNRNGPSH